MSAHRTPTKRPFVPAPIVFTLFHEGLAAAQNAVVDLLKEEAEKGKRSDEAQLLLDLAAISDQAPRLIEGGTEKGFSLEAPWTAAKRMLRTVTDRNTWFALAKRSLELELVRARDLEKGARFFLKAIESDGDHELLLSEALRYTQAGLIPSQWYVDISSVAMEMKAQSA